jgi:hypothetical protein
MDDRNQVEELARTAGTEPAPVSRTKRGGRIASALGGVALVMGALVVGGIVGAGLVTGAGRDLAAGALAPIALAVSGDATADTTAGTGPWGDGHRHGDRRMGHGPRGGFIGGNGPAEELAAAATALGVTGEELVTALRSGKSIAQVATDEGVALQTVVDAIVAVEKSEIAAALAAGRITQAQADEMTANVTAHVTEMVNRVPGDGPGGRHGGPGGRHGGPGDCPNPDATDSTSGTGGTTS